MIRNDILQLMIGALMLMLFACIYPHELRTPIIPPLYDEWSEGYSETSPEIIMAQLDDFDEPKNNEPMNDMTLLMPFVDQSENFVHGFECGQLWLRMEQGFTFDNYVFHTENLKQVEMMCMRFHYTHRIDKIDDCWSSLFANVDKSKAN